VIQPDIPVALVVEVVFRVEKQRILVGAVVDDVIHDDAYAPGVGLTQKLTKIGLAAVIGFQLAIVGDRIAVVVILALVDGHQPDPLYAQALEVIEPGGEPLEIADAIAVGILVAAHIDLHKDRSL
jgi:hypothetical protein